MSYLKSCRMEDDWNIDLHVHTSFSDGCYLPEDTVKLAYQKDIKYLSITDHDTLLGLETAKRACAEHSIELITGIELNTDYQGQEVHILGYHIDLDYRVLLDELKEMVEYRAARAEKMVNILIQMGLAVKMSDVREKAGPAGILGRPHIAQVLKDRGVVKTVEEAFHLFLEPGCPAYVPRNKLTPFDAAALIKEAGGVSVLAHPNTEQSFQLLPALIENGLQGIEAYHPKVDSITRSEIIKKAKEYDLVVTGGSDFHGHENGAFSNLGGMNVPFASVDGLNRLKRRSVLDKD